MTHSDVIIGQVVTSSVKLHQEAHYIFDNVIYNTHIYIYIYIIGNITIQGTKLGNLTTTVSNFTYFHFM